MKILAVVCFLLGPVLDMAQVRELYHQAAVSKHAALQLQAMLSEVDSSSAPVLACYKGATEMMQAKYTMNPIAKLKNFSDGKNQVEMAINRDTTNLEMRFIRFSIQNNLPAFLGYNSNRQADQHFLISKTKDHNDVGLRQMIVKYISSLPDITQYELKQLKN